MGDVGGIVKDVSLAELRDGWTPRLRPVGVNASAVPGLLRRHPHWVLWAYERTQNGKLTKVPYRATAPHKKASSTNPATWAAFELAITAYERDTTRFAGIGFVLTSEIGLVGVDLDHCIDPETGDESPEASEILAALNSYTEVTPSGTGLRVFVAGHLPAGRRKNGPMEMYNAGRFLTVTGARYGEYPYASEPGPLEFPR